MSSHQPGAPMFVEEIWRVERLSITRYLIGEERDLLRNSSELVFRRRFVGVADARNQARRVFMIARQSRDRVIVRLGWWGRDGALCQESFRLDGETLRLLPFTHVGDVAEIPAIRRELEWHDVETLRHAPCADVGATRVECQGPVSSTGS